MKYPIIIHKDKNSDYGVTVPDLIGCFSAGETLEKAIENTEEAILTHVEGLILDKEAIPQPTSLDKYKNKKYDGEIYFAVVSVDFSKLSDKIKRVNITIPERLLSKLDSFAIKEGESRSGFLVHAAMEYIHTHS
ncbi:type II toxin-antitoxin system HicB family antitoxin [Candidatus Poribacteria bacterium]|nr:type II toxin-antitoxin system HicB family antitoxin [Candidatus Poribacteria bacterium]